MSAATPGWVDDLLRWLHECAARFSLAARETQRAADRVERCWTDDRGREWVQRAGLVRRQLDRDAEACAALAERVTRTVEAGALADAGPDGEASAWPLLGSTVARRVDAARGMRIATLSDEESLPGR
jgi:hypothetical protein